VETLEQEVNQLHSELCAGFAEKLKLPQPTTSRHLKLLRERNLVIAEREGTSVYYTLADRRVIDALDILRAVLADHLTSRANLAQSVSDSLGE
jgi:ArsR family transcriptional regulator